MLQAKKADWRESNKAKQDTGMSTDEESAWSPPTEVMNIAMLLAFKWYHPSPNGWKKMDPTQGKSFL